MFSYSAFVGAGNVLHFLFFFKYFSLSYRRPFNKKILFLVYFAFKNLLFAIFNLFFHRCAKKKITRFRLDEFFFLLSNSLPVRNPPCLSQLDCVLQSTDWRKSFDS